jgi:hypothetical protein
MGRKNIELTPEQIQVIEAGARFLTSEQLADLLGIGKTTFFAILNRDEKINELYKKSKAQQHLRMANNLMKQSDSGSTAATIFYLKCQAGWKETMHIDHSSSDGTMTPSVIERVIVEPTRSLEEITGNDKATDTSS